MGVVTISSSASRTSLGLGSKYSDHVRFTPKKPLMVVAFKADHKTNNNKTSLVAPNEPIVLPVVTRKEIKNRTRKAKKSLKRPKAVATDEVLTSTSMEGLDYNEAAAKLESIFKLSPATEKDPAAVIRSTRTRTKTRVSKRLSLEKRIELKRNKEEQREEGIVSSVERKRKVRLSEKDKIEILVKEYSSSTNLGNLDWKKMKIPPVLPSSEHAWLFKLMQPFKELLKVREHMENACGREPTNAELAESTNMSVVEVKRNFMVGRAARNKLIKHNLRLVLFVMNKYFQDFTNGPKYQDLCQAGVKGLITAIDRFEPNKKFRLSTYGLFWIRHAIVRSMTVSNFTRVSFGLESVRREISKAKQELSFELSRSPTEDEIIERVGISPERYREVTRASKPVKSLNSKHIITQEEIIDTISDSGGDERRKPAVLRLAIDDVLDSLKPKENLVIRQRYGLDGKGDRTLGEIAGNLNISREMVRKYEVKALMKLKHPARVEYLRQYME